MLKFEMRVIAGEFRSRKLIAPPGVATRPTSDRLRETLFNVLAPRIDGASFLDLYAGSGAVGIEAISRGAGRVVFVERAQDALVALRANLTQLGIRGEARVQAGSVLTYLKRGHAGAFSRFDIVYLDPPYDAEQEYGSTLELLGGGSSSLPAAGAVVIAEHRRKLKLEDRYGELRRARLLQQGDAALSFYTADREEQL
jgi:16S rRNA (guanine966-N2)-methyltransferase